MFAPVYFDHNATTPVHPAVLEAMLPWLSGQCGNPSSRHEYGRQARVAVDRAREQVAAALGAHPTEIIFTSGGSEANNLFIKGVAETRQPGRLAVSAIEHPCVMKPAEQLARRGWHLEVLAVDDQGRVDAQTFDAAMALRPVLASVMLANNETGVLQDIPTLAARAKAQGVWFHTDAVQAAGKLPVDFRALNAVGVNALTVSGHKFGGPKGVGVLVVDKRVELTPQIAGGGHERGLRSGTENVPAIVGMGAACERLLSQGVQSANRLAALRERLENGIRALGGQCFSASAVRLPNTSFFAFTDVEGETLVGKLDRAGFAVASGSACSSSQPEPSHVLQAMGVAPSLARCAVRVSLGAGNTEQEVDSFLATLQSTLGQLQTLTALAVAE